MLNLSVKVAVSDPWEFGSEHGDRALIATIVACPSNERLVLRLKEPFTYKGKLTAYLVADSRHEGMDFHGLVHGTPIPANFLPLSAAEGASTVDAIAATIRTWRGWTLVGTVVG